MLKRFEVVANIGGEGGVGWRAATTVRSEPSSDRNSGVVRTRCSVSNANNRSTPTALA